MPDYKESDKYKFQEGICLECGIEHDIKHVFCTAKCTEKWYSENNKDLMIFIVPGKVQILERQQKYGNPENKNKSSGLNKIGKQLLRALVNL